MNGRKRPGLSPVSPGFGNRRRRRNANPEYCEWNCCPAGDTAPGTCSASFCFSGISRGHTERLLLGGYRDRRRRGYLLAHRRMSAAEAWAIMQSYSILTRRAHFSHSAQNEWGTPRLPVATALIDGGCKQASRRRVRKILRNNATIQPAHSQRTRISHARGEERIVDPHG